jgi:hypothetical protein
MVEHVILTVIATVIPAHAQLAIQEQTVKHITLVTITNAKMEQHHNQMEILAHVYVQHSIQELSAKLTLMLVPTIHV